MRVTVVMMVLAVVVVVEVVVVVVVVCSPRNDSGTVFTRVVLSCSCISGSVSGCYSA